MKAAQSTLRSKSPPKSAEGPPKGPESGFYVRFGVIAETSIDVDSEKLANEVVEALAKDDFKSLMMMKALRVMKFEVVGSGSLGLSQIADVRLREGSTVNKVSLKKSTALNPPAKVKEGQIEKILTWFDVAENVRWARPEHMQWFERYKKWYVDNGYLTQSQIKGLRGTQAKIKYRDRTHGQETLARTWSAMLEDGDKKKAKVFYKKHLQKYEKT
jgi:hypothetical protein